jgi:Uri superfamily endonuclease
MSAEAKIEVGMSVFRDVFGGPAPTIFQSFSLFKGFFTSLSSSDSSALPDSSQFRAILTLASRSDLNALPDSIQFRAFLIGQFAPKFFGRRRKRRRECAQGEVIVVSARVVQSFGAMDSRFSAILDLSQVLNSANFHSLSIWGAQQRLRIAITYVGTASGLKYGRFNRSLAEAPASRWSIQLLCAKCRIQFARIRAVSEKLNFLEASKTRQPRNSILFGDGRQGNKTNVAGNQTGLQGCHQHTWPLTGCYLTWLVEPCGALPRKCYYYCFRFEGALSTQDYVECRDAMWT